MGVIRPGGRVAVDEAAVVSVAASASAVTLLDENNDARLRAVFNDSTATLYLKFGASASATSFTVKITAGSYFEFPTGPLYTGLVTGAWSSATGAARVTEG